MGTCEQYPNCQHVWQQELGVTHCAPTRCAAAIVRSWDGSDRTFVCDRETGHAGAHRETATDDERETVGLAAVEWQEEHAATLATRMTKGNGRPIGRLFFRDECSCGWRGEWQSTAGLAHSAHDWHVRAMTTDPELAEGKGR